MKVIFGKTILEGTPKEIMEFLDLKKQSEETNQPTVSSTPVNIKPHSVKSCSNREKKLVDKKFVTDSLTVAEIFGKKHKNVLRDINTQLKKIKEVGEEEWAASNFEKAKYRHPDNKQWYPKYNLTEEAFAIVAMGYVTPKAMEIKVKLVQKIKRMNITRF